MKRLQVVFIAVVFALLLVPSVGTTWAPTIATTENRTLAAPPAALSKSGSPNLNFFSDFGTFFDDHFAYRNELVTLNAELRVAAFGVSPYPSVVVGQDSAGSTWTYYSSTINDFVGTAPLTDQQLDSIANNLATMQSATQASGAKFLFLIAPNKNSIYPENMPSYYLRTSDPTNSERLVPYLEARGVNYLNLFDVLRQAKAADPERLLYFRTDSHWNNIGALLATNAVCEMLDIEPLNEPAEWIKRADHWGDLGSMLYPVKKELEVNGYYGGINDEEDLTGASWGYTNDAQDTFAETVTTNGVGEGSVLMYRDSFANTMIPYLAAQTASGYYSRLVPYDLDLISELAPDYVIVERAERHLDFLADAPLL